MNYEMEIKAGDRVQVNFGAQKQAVLEQKLQSEAQQAITETRSPLLGAEIGRASCRERV